MARTKVSVLNDLNDALRYSGDRPSPIAAVRKLVEVGFAHNELMATQEDVSRVYAAVEALEERVGKLASEHAATARMAATNDPGLLERVSKLESAESVGTTGGQFVEQRLTELERLVGILVKSLGAVATAQQPRSDGAGPFIAALDRVHQPASYGPVPSPYGQPSPAHAVDSVAYKLIGWGKPGAPVEDASVEYVGGEPTIRVQVSGVLYRFRAPEVVA